MDTGPSMPFSIPRAWGAIARYHPGTSARLTTYVPATILQIAKRLGARPDLVLVMARRLELNVTLDHPCSSTDVDWLAELFDRVRCAKERLPARPVEARAEGSPATSAPISDRGSSRPETTRAGVAHETLEDLRVQFRIVRKKALITYLHEHHLSRLVPYLQQPITGPDREAALDALEKLADKRRRELGSGRQGTFGGSSGPPLLTVDGSSYW